jgi:hypothetical protein
VLAPWDAGFQASRLRGLCSPVCSTTVQAYFIDGPLWGLMPGRTDSVLFPKSAIGSYLRPVSSLSVPPSTQPAWLKAPRTPGLLTTMGQLLPVHDPKIHGPLGSGVHRSKTIPLQHTSWVANLNHRRAASAVAIPRLPWSIPDQECLCARDTGQQDHSHENGYRLLRINGHWYFWATTHSLPR